MIDEILTAQCKTMLRPKLKQLREKRKSQFLFPQVL